MIKACAIIPVYNHHLKIESVVEAVLAHGLDCYLLDDGSEPLCGATLDCIAKRQGVSLLRWRENRGKGAVVCDGILRANADGYSHALQIDADGQHCTAQLSEMLAMMQAHSHAVISANRPYLKMPKSRRNGRKLTDFWVCVNTLSRAIKDSMCGFRIYPVEKTAALIMSRPIGRRMDFDTDILVRLYWLGVEVVHVETDVIYDAEIPSHFDMWRDNLRISLMHTRLFLGMLVKSPQLILRHFK